MTLPAGTMAERIAEVRAQIAAACRRAGRPVDSVRLIAVSKTHPAPLVIEAVAAGLRDFGENRVEEADKMALVEQAVSNTPGWPLTWHMIGHVQSRKARDVIRHFQWIHSLDSVKLAEKYAGLIGSEAAREALLEVNVSGEASKEGLDASRWLNDRAQRESLWGDIRRMIEFPRLHIRGLMTVAPLVEHPDLARPVFANLRALSVALAADFPTARWDTLSMGMTDDYPVAIEEGATMIRVGRAIFGVRA